MEELKAKVKSSSQQLKKASGMVNKFAALSAKGKCSDEDWSSAIDNWIDTVDQCFEILIQTKEI